MVIPCTLDVIIIALISVAIIECVKVPIKCVLIKKGLQDNKKVFKVITLTASTLFCFIASGFYFWVIKGINPFTAGIIWTYTSAVVTLSQVFYKYLETYGRDGLYALVRSLLAKHKTQTDIKELEKKKATATQFAEQLKQLYEGSPVTVEDVEQILDHIQ